MQFHSIVLSLFSSLIAPFGGFFASGFKRAFKVKVYRESTFFCIDNVYRYWNADLHSVTCDLIFIYVATHHELLWIVRIYDPVTHQKELRKHSPVGGLVTCQLSILLSKIVFVNFSREPMNTACHLAGLHWLLQSSVEEAARDINFRSTFKKCLWRHFDFQLHCPIKKCLKWWKLHL